MQDFTNYTPRTGGGAIAGAVSGEAVFFQRVYSWMFLGLAVTAGVAYALMSSQAWVNLLVTSRFALIGACLVQLGLVFYLTARINRIEPVTAKGLFLAYSAVTGATFSVIGLAYAPMAIFKAFVTTAGLYGAMAAYGLVTRRSLEAWGSFLFMGLVGLIIASLVNMFLGSGTMDMAICVIGVLVFAGLTAYDHQKLRVVYGTGLGGADEAGVSRVVVLGALTLYLDFINLFLFLLRFFGQSRE